MAIHIVLVIGVDIAVAERLDLRNTPFPLPERAGGVAKRVAFLVSVENSNVAVGERPQLWLAGRLGGASGGPARARIAAIVERRLDAGARIGRWKALNGCPQPRGKKKTHFDVPMVEAAADDIGRGLI